jgi:tetratricopeptide (TPR) repeat protein
VRAPGSLPRFFFCLLGWGGVVPSLSNPPYEVRLERFSRDIEKNPGQYSKRIERASLLLNEGGAQDTLRADIDTLLSHAAWRAEGECLEARRLYQQGRLEEARMLIRKNLHGGMRIVEQARLLAALELRAKDTVRAIEAYTMAWDHAAEESDYIELVLLHAERRPPEGLLEKGLRLYPKSPAVNRSVFEVYFAAGDSAGMERARGIAARAADTLWPLGVDWKIRHGRVLIALKKGEQAELVLLGALEILDGDPRLQGKNSEAYRGQIFTLLEEARAAGTPSPARRP